MVAVIARHALTRQLAHVTAAPELNGGGRARAWPRANGAARPHDGSTIALCWASYTRLLFFRPYAWSLLLPRMCIAHPSSWVISICKNFGGEVNLDLYWIFAGGIVPSSLVPKPSTTIRWDIPSRMVRPIVPLFGHGAWRSPDPYRLPCELRYSKTRIY